MRALAAAGALVFALIAAWVLSLHGEATATFAAIACVLAGVCAMVAGVETWRRRHR